MGIIKQMDWSKEYSEEADKRRKALVEQSYYKYGSAAVNFGRKLVNALETSEKCVEKYSRTKNKEYLLDAMNYLMFEYMYPGMEGTYFQYTNSDASAGIAGMSILEMERMKENDGGF